MKKFLILLLAISLSFSLFGCTSSSPGSSADDSQQSQNTNVIYTNDQYGFHFTLPKSWQGYTLLTDTWKGTDVASGIQTESGPMILIRHPEWKENQVRQDIPIMIFTLSQWESVEQETLSVSAAPIPPSELGRNSSYVFALPARYNFAYPEGAQEVEDIIAGNPLEPTEISSP